MKAMSRCMESKKKKRRGGETVLTLEQPHTVKPPRPQLEPVTLQWAAELQRLSIHQIKV
jgi:hypothetical protein